MSDGLFHGAWRAVIPTAVRGQAYRLYESARLWATIGRALVSRAVAPRPRRPPFSGPLRVLLVTGSFPPMRCGVGDYTAQLAAALSSQANVTLEVLTTIAESGRDANPPWLHREVREWSRDGLEPFRKALRAFRPDIVHLQVPTQGYRTWWGIATLPSIARHEAQAGVVTTWHEYPEPPGTVAGSAYLAMGAAIDALIYVRPDFERHVTGILRRVLRKVPHYFVPNAASVPVATVSESDRRSLRAEIAAEGRSVVAHFGFAYPHKAVHLIFQIADSAKHHLLLIGELNASDPYHAQLLAQAASPPWKGHVTLRGFAEPQAVARYLACADAAVFPFADGGGVWNSSVHAAMAQGTFTLVTSRDRSGYAEDENTYYAKPGAIAEMKEALERYAGARRTPDSRDEWQAVAAQHVQIYRAAAQRGSRK